MDRWENADRLLGCTAVCATVSKYGMCAFHSTAAVMPPGGTDYYALDGGKTFNMGLFASPERDGLLDIRPGYEEQVRKQLSAHYGGKQPTAEPDADAAKRAADAEAAFGFDI